MSNKTFSATVNLENGLTVRAKARDHEIVMDEPEGLGGKDKGMTPVELALCCLGGCLSICARIFAKSCEVEMVNLSIDLEGDIDLRGIKGAKGVAPGFQEIRFILNIESNSPEENIQNLIKLIKARCPISDSLKSNITVKGDYKIK